MYKMKNEEKAKTTLTASYNGTMNEAGHYRNPASKLKKLTELCSNGDRHNVQPDRARAV